VDNLDLIAEMHLGIKYVLNLLLSGQ